MTRIQDEPKSGPIEEIVHAVRMHERFAVFSHEEPDGDAIGSQIALALALRRLGKQVVALRLEPVPPALEFLNRDSVVEAYRPDFHRDRIERAQVVMVVDSSSYRRLGILASEATRSRAITINIDHHRDNKFFADINLVRSQAGGAAELVFEVIRAIGAPVENAIAEAVYVGICTDTLGFRYVDPEGNLLSVISELVKAGIDIEDLQERIYYMRPDSYLDDIAGLLGSVRYENGGSLAWFAFPTGSHLTYYQRELGMEALQQLLSVKRIRAAFMLHGMNNGIEVWFRSKTDVDVGQAAERLGGGGHKTASGVLLKGMDLDRAVHEVLSQIKTVMGGERVS
jgi:phosphoesterase RecJ-like protein